MSREYGWDIVGNDGFRPGMVGDVAGRVDFMLPAQAETLVPVRILLEEGAATTGTLKASLTYVWFMPPPPEAQNHMQEGIIARMEGSSSEERERILDVEIPKLMAAKNTMESAYAPVAMAIAEVEFR
jgi:hypothetical protein